MTDSVNVYAKALQATTINQQNSQTSFQFELSKQTLSQLLGWRPDGKGIEEVETLLREGVGVEIRQGPDGIAFLLVPFVGELAENTVPAVGESVVVRRLSKS